MYIRVCTGHVKPGKSWNFTVAFSRPGKSWNLNVGHGNHGKIMTENYCSENNKARNTSNQ